MTEIYFKYGFELPAYRSVVARLRVCLGWFIVCSSATLAAEKVDFSRDISPILSDRCFACHGPDSEARKADLRFDVESDLLRAADSGFPIIKPSDADHSELFRRIMSADPDEMMPPPDFLVPVTDSEKALIKRWIEEGAEWSSHWAFKKIQSPNMPEIHGDAIIRNPIDRFVESKAQEKGLSSTMEASRERLLRRVSLDLTGLPPTPELRDSFLKDKDPQAYDRLVDQLLASERFGERMAMDWLDIARFADTYGYQSDRFNHMWPWRDWVINAFNRNLPYDQFITQQMAGDLMENKDQETVLATAFHRNHRQTNEGGSTNEEFRVEYNADRLKTTALAFLGLTMECARCHDHKYDPISQADYYSMFAFFNSTDESGLYSHFTDAIPSPTHFLYRDEQQAKHSDLKGEIQRLESMEDTIRKNAEEAFNRWWKENPEAGIDPDINLTGYFNFEDKSKEGYVNHAKENHHAKVSDNPSQFEGPKGKALQFDGENSISIDQVADFNRTQPFSMSAWIHIPRERERIIVMHHSKAGSDAGSRGYELLLENGHAAFALIHFWPGNAIKVRTVDKLPLQEWLHLGWTYDGSSKAEGIHFFINGRSVDTEITRNSLYKDIAYGGKVPLQLGARFRGRGYKDGKLDELRIFDQSLSEPQILSVFNEATLPKTGEQPNLTDGWFDYWLTRYHEPYQDLQKNLLQARSDENKLINGVTEIMAMGDIKGGRKTYILNRGQYDLPGKEVKPGTPERIFPFDTTWPQNRLGLAKWLTSPDNPLTSRVVVNRFWQMFFGRGIVETAEDFGSQGSQPTHPELLDWIASWYVENEWDTKALCRLIVTSHTYRKESIPTEEMLTMDPENKWLARGPKQRLMAEMIRDQALSAADILSPKLGGPSVKPYQPPGVWKEVSGATYQASKGEGLHRRSLYTFLKRTAPPPSMLTFDATSREDCISRRIPTNTPLQALVLLNDPQFIEAARMLAQRMLLEGGDSLEDQISFGFRLVLTRKPSNPELTVLSAIFSERLESLTAPTEVNADKKETIENVGEIKWKEGLDRRQLQSLTAVSLAILNVDEAIVRR
ncbi:DUF1553 domain-containing protein [bacterium]|nr:DUF1553 domain-containing protein [Verrucomicrobiota bacterium]MDA7682276.1 DUF1553 domain-containing protein [bacterium]